MFVNLDIRFQIISLLILILLQAMFRINRKIFLIRERVFFAVLSVATFEVIMDIFHVFAINLNGKIPELFVNLICRFYLISIVIFSSCILLYSLTEIYEGKLFFDKRRYLYLVIDALAFPILLNLPIKIELSENVVCVHGNAMRATAFFGILYLIAAVYNVYMNGDKITKMRRHVVVLSCVILAAAGICQTFSHTYLILSPAISIAMIYIYFSLEPPGEYTDGILGVFNHEAYQLYLRGRISNNQSASLLYIRITDYNRMQEVFGNSLRLNFMKRLCTYLLEYKNAKTFYLGSGVFILSFEKSDYFIKNVQQIRRRISEVWNASALDEEPVEVLVNSVILAYPAERMEENLSYENVTGTIEYFASKYRTSTSDVFLCIDRREMREKQRYDHVVKSMENAIEENRVSVHYQGIYSVEEDRTVALEALMRVEDERGVYLQNDMVIDYAERTGKIRELGNVVLKKICAFLRTHSLYELEIYSIHINLSVLQCQDSKMAGDFIEIMENYQLPASMFLFEISGSLTSYTSINLKKNMDRLTEVGAKFVLDNYGHGVINVEKMVQMNLNTVKFGPEAVQGYFANAKERNLIRMDVSLMKQMGITQMAVGIETQQQYNELKKLGISYMQGMFFYKPMDGVSMLKAITRERDKGMEREALYESVL